MTKKSTILPLSPYIQYLDSLKHSTIFRDFSHYVKDIEKNSFFKNLLDLFPSRISITNYQTQEYLFINESKGEGLTGYPVKEFIKNGMAFFISQIHPDDMQVIANNSFPKILASLNKFTVEEIKQFKFSYTYRFKRKDNIWVKFLQNYVILEMDEDRNPLLLLNFVSDITPYKKDDVVISTLSHNENKNGIMNMITKHFNACINTSGRENEIIRYIANGSKTKEIAIKMHLSEYTVRAHKRNIFIKTKTKNIAQLTSFAFANGII
jgi:DNA-binding CsgD family transcriptional regulator